MAYRDEGALHEYRSDYKEPDDFDQFWRATLDAADQIPLDVHVTPVETGLHIIEVFDVTFAGFGGHPIRAWLRRPRGASGPLPGIVQFHGYASGRGHALDDLLWAAAGYAQLLMDVRGQGGDYAGGDTGDPVGTTGPSFPGFMTKGIESRESYFYRRVYVDAVRAVHTLRGLDFVDPARIAAIGPSQGGGIALAVAGLVPDLAALYAQAPLMCDIRHAVHTASGGPYQEVAGFLKAHRTLADHVFHTLGYFDGIGFARRAAAPAWFSTGLTDEVCPPSTAFGAFHAYAGPRQISAWEHNGHDAGGSEDLQLVVNAFRSLLLEES
ncbi:MAG TPA: acetylxylan esterase [Actinocrinis sp.]|jgi:cephalosporin-C deacetylase|uniref:acetylxylan esterase n=1 Tax=Actinocrinis sp. TaxID=1920516 RepID=UPI002DDDAFF0|nr:acetylxylan esterase [Actinocrinis sp.]HEV3170732.1 acetylxylan esterase [Actinocrinis sp.]